MTTCERVQQTQRVHQHSALAHPPERHHGLDQAYVQPFLAQAKAKGLRALTRSGGGEPITYPHCCTAVESTATLGIEQGLMTNGLYPASYVPVIGQHVRWIRVSLDTLDADKYAYRKVTHMYLSKR
jgi:wyosine [tRNA(Phe)-imidazoG37] synthetase (radical SAM superfamily)